MFQIVFTYENMYEILLDYPFTDDDDDDERFFFVSNEEYPPPAYLTMSTNHVIVWSTNSDMKRMNSYR